MLTIFLVEEENRLSGEVRSWKKTDTVSLRPIYTADSLSVAMSFNSYVVQFSSNQRSASSEPSTFNCWTLDLAHPFLMGKNGLLTLIASIRRNNFPDVDGINVDDLGRNYGSFEHVLSLFFLLLAVSSSVN